MLTRQNEKIDVGGDSMKESMLVLDKSNVQTFLSHVFESSRMLTETYAVYLAHVAA